MTGSDPMAGLLRACGALRPGGQLAEQVEDRISRLALHTLHRIHRGDLAISDDDWQDLLVCYWTTITRMLFPGANPYQMPKMLVRQRAGEPFEVVACDPLEAHSWPVAGNA